ncbi:large-conductance mechanosensitive channel protein MscL [Flavobacterium sp. I3-2]|uniref:large-conductance mechanosensitive channel protein MscL n=1 Tax=Flavobacterium sp. I3-2 TaxID=2748319 RepID=UPI0015B360D1|nr:large-conductance mechanosensitive channel protein MscL [Flavobacterium sp. I3-2]
MGFFTEFKEFAVKGNVIDLAVGVVIGGAFGKIVTSLVEDIITPALLTPALNAANLNNLAELVIPGTAIKYGNFISAAISFLIVAFALFLMIKGINKLKKPAAAPAPAAPAGPTQEELLMQIRDLLQKQQSK